MIHRILWAIAAMAIVITVALGWAYPAHAEAALPSKTVCNAVRPFNAGTVIDHRYYRVAGSSGRIDYSQVYCTVWYSNNTCYAYDGRYWGVWTGPWYVDKRRGLYVRRGKEFWCGP